MLLSRNGYFKHIFEKQKTYWSKKHIVPVSWLISKCLTILLNIFIVFRTSDASQICDNSEGLKDLSENV